MPDWKMISFISSSEPRFKILLHLSKTASTPSLISKELKIPLSRVSVILKELEEKELIECLTKNVRKGKFFRTTDKGIEVINDIHDLTNVK